MRKMLFIYNPKAGKGSIRTSLSYVLEEFCSHDLEVTVHPTKCSGDAVEVVKELGSAYDLIVCSGGDGTLDEVVSGMLMGKFCVPVGYIPAGSTNDFASSLGIPTQMRQAAAAIAGGNTYSCDVGKLGERYFIYVAAFGVFTDVSYKTDQSMKNMLGHAAYLLEGLKSLPALRSWHISYESDDISGEGDFLFGMITNSNSVGGFKGITGNEVTLNDGIFEVTLIKMPEFLDWALMINALLAGTYHEKIITFKTSKLTLRCDEEFPWTVDGEYGGTYSEVTVENIPRALPIVLGKQPEELLDDTVIEGFEVK